MNKWLEKNNILFIRYADDFVILNKNENELKSIKDNLEIFLSTLDLKLGIDKTYITSIKDGFNFLGIHFKGKQKIVNNERFQKTISKFHKLSKTKSSLMKYTKDLNAYLFAINNYYLKIIEKISTQFSLLEQHLIDSISYKVYICKENKEIKTKK